MVAAPAEILVDDAAALEMDVVGVAIIGRAQRDDRLERRRAAGGDLQAVEAAPGDAHHADLAGAPGLLGEPGDDLEGVVLLLLGIFVEHQRRRSRRCRACRRAGGIAVAGEIGMGEGIADDGAVALAIGQYSRIAGTGSAERVVGHPDAGREAGAVGKRDPLILDLDYGAGELVDRFIPGTGVTAGARHGPETGWRRQWRRSPPWPGRCDGGPAYSCGQAPARGGARRAPRRAGVRGDR